MERINNVGVYSRGSGEGGGAKGKIRNLNGVAERNPGVCRSREKCVCGWEGSHWGGNDLDGTKEAVGQGGNEVSGKNLQNEVSLTKEKQIPN